MPPDSRNEIPPPRQLTAPAFHAEVIALKAVVMAIAAIMTNMYERAGQGPAQEWINKIAELCDDAIAKAKFEPDGPGAEELRSAAREQVTQILAGLSAAQTGPNRPN